MSNEFSRLNESVLSVVNNTQEEFIIEEDVLNEILENLTEEEIAHIDNLYEQYENGEITEEELEEGLWSATKWAGKKLVQGAKALGRGVKAIGTEVGRAELRSKFDDRRIQKAKKADDKAFQRNQKIDAKKEAEAARQKKLADFAEKRKKDEKRLATIKRNTEAKKALNPSVGMKAGSMVKKAGSAVKNFVVNHYEQEYGITLTEEEATNLIFNYILEEKMNKEDK